MPINETCTTNITELPNHLGLRVQFKYTRRLLGVPETMTLVIHLHAVNRNTVCMDTQYIHNNDSLHTYNEQHGIDRSSRLYNMYNTPEHTVTALLDSLLSRSRDTFDNWMCDTILEGAIIPP